jgi:hypothetical protein
MDIYDNSSLNSSYNEKRFRQVCAENQNTRFINNNLFFRSSYLLWDNVEKYGTAGQATDDNITRRRKDAVFIPDN